MELIDAVIVSGLGLAVVFSGLALTALLIVGFNVLPSLVPDRTKPTAADTGRPSASSSQPSDPQVLAVITTVLEVERRLRRGESGGRLTIERSG